MTKRLAVVISGVLVLGVALLAPGTAAATPVGAQPPQPIVSFSPSGIQPNDTSALSIVLTNPNALPLNGVAFNDVLPTNVVVAPVPSVTNTCGGTLTANAGSGNVTLTGGTLTSSGSCSVTVSVTSANTGTYVDPTGPVTASESGQTSGNAGATLNVANPPAITTGFTPASVPQGATSGLYFTIQNPNSNSTAPDSDVTLTGVGFTDALPAGMAVANPNQASSDCGGTLTAVPGATTITFAGGTIAPVDPNGETGGVCNVFVEVQATSQGSLVNTTGPVRANESGAGGPSNPATLSVIAPALAPTASLAFADPSIPLHGGTGVTLTVSNPNAGASLDGLAIDNPLPAGLAVASTPAVGGTCVSAQGATVTAIAGGNGISTKNLTLPANASCTVTVALTGTASGTQFDTTHAPTATYDDGNALVPVTGKPATASITVIGPPQTTASFGASHVPLGASTGFSITITNPNSATALSGVDLTAMLPSGLRFSGPAGSCGGTPVNATPGSGTLALSGASLPAGANCTINESVSASSDGLKSVTTSTVSSIQGGAGAPSSASLLIASPPLASAYFAPATVPFGRAVRLWLTIRNPNPSVPLTGVSLTNLLPAGLRAASPSRVLGFCGRGAIVAPDAGSRIVLQGGSMPGGGHCTFSALLRLSVAGAVADRSGAPSADQTGPGTPASASLRAGPSNVISLRSVTPLSGGRFSVAVTVPGPGHIDALLSAPTASLASLRPGRGQFTYGRAAATPHHGGTVAVVISPGATGRRLLAHHRGIVRLSLHVAYTPAGGTTRTIGRGGFQPQA